MSEAEQKPTKVSRYVWSIDEDLGEEQCHDRKTGRCIISYDLGDPANYASSHGGLSKNEYLERRKLDPNEAIEIADCVMHVSPREAELFVMRMAREAQREKEEEESVELWTILADEDTQDFDFDRYIDGETDILAPALERKGYTAISFYMLEKDSFGPLARGVVANDPEGKRVRFFYG